MTNLRGLALMMGFIQACFPEPVAGDSCADTDLDGFDDDVDACIDTVETPNGAADDDGCPDEGPVSFSTGLASLTECPDCLLMIPEPNLQFEAGSSTPGGDFEAIVSAVSAKLRAKHIRGDENARFIAVSGVSIVGHTSDIGDDAANATLGQERADVVRAALVEHGLDAGLMFTISRGETSPVVSNATPEGRRENDRVEFFVEDDEVDLPGCSLR